MHIRAAIAPVLASYPAEYRLTCKWVSNLPLAKQVLFQHWLAKSRKLFATPTGGQNVPSFMPSGIRMLWSCQRFVFTEAVKMEDKSADWCCSACCGQNTAQDLWQTTYYCFILFPLRRLRLRKGRPKEVCHEFNHLQFQRIAKMKQLQRVWTWGEYHGPSEDSWKMRHCPVGVHLESTWISCRFDLLPSVAFGDISWFRSGSSRYRSCWAPSSRRRS